MIKPETRNRLEEFNKRVEYIRTLSYFNGGKNTVGFEIKEAGKIDFYEPNDEQRDALLLNVRLFLQDKDDISIRRLTDLFDDPGISSEWKKEYELHRKELNKRLDWVAVEGLKGKITHRDILDMFLYGRFGHHNQNDRSYKLYKKWVTDENTYAIMHNTFHKILIWVVAIISNIAVMNREELQRHEK